MTDLFPIPQIDKKKNQENKEKINDQTIKEQKQEDNKITTFVLCNTKLLGIQHKDDDNRFFISHLSCVSVFREIGNHSSGIHLRNRIKKANELKYIEVESLIPNCQWNVELKEWEHVVFAKDIDDEAEKDYFIKVGNNLQNFLSWALKGVRKSQQEKNKMFEKFDIKLTTEEINDIKVPIEVVCLDLLSQCIPYPIEYQHRVGKYKLDAFIPRLRLGIQIDENNHRYYDQQEEKEYDTVLRDHNIVLVRFNPNGKYLYSPAAELVRIIWNKTISPDFICFREKNKLC